MEVTCIEEHHEIIEDIVEEEEEEYEKFDIRPLQVKFDSDEDDPKYRKKNESIIEVVEKQQKRKHIHSYHKLAWLSLIMCFPFGCIALIRSFQVKYALHNEKYEKAEHAANATKKYITWSIIFGVILMCLMCAILLGTAADI